MTETERLVQNFEEAVVRLEWEIRSGTIETVGLARDDVDAERARLLERLNCNA